MASGHTNVHLNNTSHTKTGYKLIHDRRTMNADAPRPSSDTNFRRFSIDQGNEEDGDLYEKNGLLGLRSSRAKHTRRWISDSWFNILIILNAGFSLFLLLGFVLLARQKGTVAPSPPYSPLREDGVVGYINTQYKPSEKYRSTNPDTEEAWNSWLIAYDHLVLIPKEKAISEGLPESADAFNDPGYVPYGLGVYHQIHCLNRIRKTFHKERWFPNATEQELDFHRDHCIDLIRQAILCHGDISLVYWWNPNYTSVDEGGVRHHTEEYLQKSPEERAMGSYAHWDTPVQCRDMDAISDWVEEHRMENDKYGGDMLD